MRRLLGPILALVLPLLGCCFSGDFAEQFEQDFCAGYQRSFVDTCTNTCVQNAGAAAQAQCATGCQSALLQDATWVSQCSDSAATVPAVPSMPAGEPVPPGAPAPTPPQ